MGGVSPIAFGLSAVSYVPHTVELHFYSPWLEEEWWGLG